MLKICEQNKGAISVFLTLILLPTFIFGGVIIDGSRILGAKNIISGAGELAMNGALSDYHEELNKTYGLLAMASTAEEIESITQDFFETSLNASGVSRENFNKALVYLELMDDDFSISNIPGSEIYETEVIKQEILEYMKYRAPVTLLQRGITEKLETLKNVEKERKAADSQLKFESELDDMQKLFDDLKKLTDEQERIYKEIKTGPQFNAMLKETKEIYEDITWMSIAYKRIRYCNDTKSDGLENLMKEMWDLAPDVNSFTPEKASRLIKMKIIENSMKGKNASDILDGIKKGTPEYTEKQRIISNYSSAKAILSDGTTKLEKAIDALVKKTYENMNGQRELAVDGEKNCQDIKEQIDKIKKKFEKLEEKYETWKEAVKELPDGETKEEYEKNIAEVEGFFEKKGALAEFEEKISNNEKFYGEVWKNNLDNVTFIGLKVDKDITKKSKFMGEANGGIIKEEGEIRNAGAEFMVRYHDIEKMTLNYTNIDIKEDVFLKQVKDFYCNSDDENKDAADGKATEWDNKLSEKVKKLGELLLSSDLEELDVLDAGKNDIPSVWLGMVEVTEAEEDEDGNEGKISTAGGMKNEGKRKEMSNSGSDNLNKDNASISDMSKLGDMVAQAGEAVVEPLFLTEYVMGMFSHNTSDKDEKGQEITEPKSLSKDDLKSHALYRAEIEYILWGDSNIRDNVGATKAIIFAVNMIFNMSFAFTNRDIRTDAQTIANLFPVGALGKTAIKCALQTIVATIETTENMLDIMEGKPVPLLKSDKSWKTWIFQGGKKGSENLIGFTYEDYLWVLVCIKMFIPSQQTELLARTADCIELNMTDKKNEDKNDNTLKDKFTMVEIDADVSIDTFFLQKLNGAGYNVQEVDEDFFKIQYQGVQGY